MALDADNVVVAASGKVFLAPDGTVLPTDATTALNAAFIELGYVSEDGVTFTPEITVEGVPAWQSLSPIRNLLTEYAITAEMTLLEWKKETLELYFGGGVFTDNLDDTWDFLLPAPGEQDVYALVIEGHDGIERYRIVLDRVQLDDAGETTFNKGEAAGLPVTVRALAGLTAGRPGAIYGDTSPA
jgi:hypothetical protein